MKEIISLFILVCSSIVSAATFYVAPTGNDNNPGSISQPWKTWAKALSSRSPGDIVYFRGGIYPTTVTTGYGINASINGKPGSWITFVNYPGEVPILDCSNVTSVTSAGENEGISFNGSYFKVKGLHVRNVHQIHAYAVPADECDAFIVYGNHIIIENCKSYNTHGVGFKANRCDEVYFINCDTWNNVDSLTNKNHMPGNNGYGWFVEDLESSTRHVYIKKCRAWLCGDDGFQASITNSCVEFDSCWAVKNGAYYGEGHGFKLGWQQLENTTVRRIVKNCIAAYNEAHGYTTNEEQGQYTSFMNVFNNIAYHNTHNPTFKSQAAGFMIFDAERSDVQELGRVFRNNISFDNERAPIVVDGGALYTHSNNTWDGGGTVTAADFEYLPATESEGIRLLLAERNADGSLPDIGNFLHLAKGSDLIDKGTDVGLPYYGSTPDIGAYEFNLGTTEPPVPVYITSVIENDNPSVLEMTYSLSLANIVPAASVFSVKVNSSTIKVSSVEVTGAKVMLMLESPVAYEDEVTISYTQPDNNPIQTNDGGMAASINDQLVINHLLISKVSSIKDAGYYAVLLPGKLVINSFNELEEILCSLYTMEGTLVNRQKFYNISIEIDISSYSSGVYLIDLYKSQQKISLKVVIP